MTCELIFINLKRRVTTNYEIIKKNFLSLTRLYTMKYQYGFRV